MTDDALVAAILTYLADRYQPVLSDWVETAWIARDLSLELTLVDRCCLSLGGHGLVEVSPSDEENPSSAAIITTKGLLAIGRAP